MKIGWYVRLECLTVIKIHALFHRSMILHCSNFLKTVSFSTTKMWVAVVLRSIIPLVKCGNVIPIEWKIRQNSIHFYLKKNSFKWYFFSNIQEILYHFYQYCSRWQHYSANKFPMVQRWVLWMLIERQVPKVSHPKGSKLSSTLRLRFLAVA